MIKDVLRDRLKKMKKSALGIDDYYRPVRTASQRDDIPDREVLVLRQNDARARSVKVAEQHVQTITAIEAPTSVAHLH